MKNSVIFIIILSFFVLASFVQANPEIIDQEVTPVNDEVASLDASDPAFPQAVIQELKSLNDKIENLETINIQLNAEIKHLDTALTTADDDLQMQIQSNRNILAIAFAKNYSLQAQIFANNNAFNQTARGLDSKINEANQQISDIGNSLSKNTLWTIIGILIAIIISGVVYWLLRNKQQSVKADIVALLSQTKTAIDENLVQEFDKQAIAMEALMKLFGEQQSTANTEPDHSLALKVASEVNIIERNISLMDAGTKGLKQLNRSVEKLKDNLAANGYDMPILLGKPFNQGMKVIVVNSIPDENLEKDTEIITKVLMPQINYNGTMIQAAQIEVSVGR